MAAFSVIKTRQHFSNAATDVKCFSEHKNKLIQHYNKTNSVVWVREQAIPTERPPLVGEVTANFYGQRVPRGRDGSLRPYSRFSRQEPLLFYQVSPQLYSRGWVDPVPDPLQFNIKKSKRHTDKWYTSICETCFLRNALASQQLTNIFSLSALLSWTVIFLVYSKWFIVFT
jgi:hypothetical protein